MLDLFEWARSFPVQQRPWLIAGKGPSFSQLDNIDSDAYFVVSLNHAVRAAKVDVAHFVDLDAFEDCGEAALSNAGWVLMPYRPHVKFRASETPLPELLKKIPILSEIDRLGRLVCYNLSTGAPFGNSPIIHAGHFGSEIVISILALLGVKKIRTLGIDGGNRYSPLFADLAARTLLANGKTSFDSQFVGILRTVEEHGIDFAPLTDRIRVFIGTDESQRVAARVLEYSITKHASQPVEFIHLDKFDVPLPRDPRNQPRTGFSFKRFAIPSACGYRGRAIYLDSDMLVFGDIAELWETPMEAKSVLCVSQNVPPEAWRDNESFQTGPQMSVMLMDCSRLHWDPKEIVHGLDEGRYSYAQLMFDLCIVPSAEIAPVLPAEWNSLETFEAGKTKLLHYTVVPTQPWISDDNPLQQLWINIFSEAVAAGAIDTAEVEHAVANGFIKPTLAACLGSAPSRDRRAGMASAPLWELQMKAAQGATLIAQARASALEREIEGLKNRIRRIQSSWTWRFGSMITHPLATLKSILQRFATILSSSISSRAPTRGPSNIPRL